MLLTLKMPKLSPTMETGTIVKWHKQEMDFLNVGDVLVDIATDKAVISHSATEEGWLRFLIASEGEKITVGQTIAVVSSEKDETANRQDFLIKQEKTPTEDNVPEPNPDSSAPTPSSRAAGSSQVAFAPERPLGEIYFNSPNKKTSSPLARSLARSKNLDLSATKGTGPGGRIVKRDLDYAPKKGLVSFFKNEDESCCPGAYEELPLSPIREVIATRLQASKASVPHFYLTQHVRASALLSVKNQMDALGLKFSINDFVTRACAIALKDFPNINSGFNSVSNKIVMFQTIDISFAVSTSQGLITPIIRCADKKNLQDLREEIQNLVSKAKSGSLKEQEYKGGSFCISNLGMTGVSGFSAIINPPQTAILALGAIETRPVVENDTIVIGKEMSLNLSVDHRVVDGMEAALFLKHIQLLLENPAGLLLN